MIKSSLVHALYKLTLFLVVIPCVTSAQTTEVSGQILPGKSYPLELWTYNLETNKYQFEKKLELTEDGAFHFEIPKTPNLYKLWLSGKGLVFVNDHDEHIQIHIDLKNSASPFKIEGSTASNNLLDYMITVEALQEKYLKPLEPKLKKAMKTKDEAQIAQIEKKYQENKALFVQTLDKKISSMGSSLGVYAIIRTLDFNKYLSNIESWYNTFESDRPDSPFTAGLQKMIVAARKLQVGSKAPEFELSVYENEHAHKLSDFRGQMVFIDFWASWCLPCRKENKVLKETYDQLKTNGIRIWSISTDQKEKKWRMAVKKDELPWLQSWAGQSKIDELYQVVSLPTNFLIDEKGKIIAKNLSAKELLDFSKKQ
ncbi:MAG: TlpA family protein disulfide reductase [Chitinophagales bacterium]|nr:TlpA family protein disulfide reductase [Chitinophagales bacterium]